MKRIRSPFTEANPFIAWSNLAWKAGEMMLASAQVIGHRSSRIAQAGIIPNARDQREFTLMGKEKIDAANASAQAMAVRMIGINQQLAAITIRQFTQGASAMLVTLTAPGTALASKHQSRLIRNLVRNSLTGASQVSGSLARLAHHGLDPIHARATGNARRLSKK